MPLACLAFIDVSGGEFIFIVVIAILLYGGDLPKVARSLGRVVGDLRRQAESLTREFRDYDDSRPRLPRRDFSGDKAPEPVEPPPRIAPPAQPPVDSVETERTESSPSNEAAPPSPPDETRKPGDLEPPGSTGHPPSL